MPNWRAAAAVAAAPAAAPAVAMGQRRRRESSASVSAAHANGGGAHGGGGGGGGSHGGGGGFTSKILREVADATRTAQTLSGMASVHSYAQCAVRLMTLARGLERLKGDAAGAEGATAEEMWSRAAVYWKHHAANAADNSEEYLVSSSCYKLAAACGMRAHRMRQQRGKQSEKASAQRAAEEVMHLGAEVSALVKASSASAAAAELTVPREVGLRIEAALAQLAGLSRALSDYETGVGLAKAFASSAPKAVRARTPALDNFAALGSSDAISMGEGLVGLALEMAKQAAAAGGADDGSGDE